MLQITCPYCGVRDQSEFACGGEWQRPRPPHPEQASDAEWADYQFYRDNPKGLIFERWVHSFGCRQWFNAVRDTVTHEFIETGRIGEPLNTPLPGRPDAPE
jgi:sarcosine oxidase, subunit delta